MLEAIPIEDFTERVYSGYAPRRYYSRSTIDLLIANSSVAGLALMQERMWNKQLVYEGDLRSYETGFLAAVKEHIRRYQTTRMERNEIFEYVKSHIYTIRQEFNDLLNALLQEPAEMIAA